MSQDEIRATDMDTAEAAAGDRADVTSPRAESTAPDEQSAEHQAAGEHPADGQPVNAPPADHQSADGPPADHQSAGTGLWSGDTGVLHERTRRVLLELLKGPYVSGSQNPGLWAALIADETSVRSRLHELFLDLVIDHVDEFAFTRKVVTEEIDVPSAVRSERLTFIDTAMLLVLRQLLLAAPGERRVIVGKDDVYDSLMIYRTGDEATFLRNLNGAWARMSNRLRVLHKVGEERFEISPMVRFLIDEDRVRELAATYRRIAVGEATLGEEDIAGEDTLDEDALGEDTLGEDATQTGTPDDTGPGDNLGEDLPDADGTVPDATTPEDTE